MRKYNELRSAREAYRLIQNINFYMMSERDGKIEDLEIAEDKEYANLLFAEFDEMHSAVNELECRLMDNLVKEVDLLLIDEDVK